MHRAAAILLLLNSLVNNGAVASPFNEAVNFFNQAEKIALDTISSMKPAVNRFGKCVKISQKNKSQERAFALFFSTGEFGKVGFISFEHFKEGETDQSILKNAEFTHLNYWGSLFETKDGLFQKAHDTSYANHLIEYRLGRSSDHKEFLIRRYYADRGIFDRKNNLYIAAFDSIELCWVEL